MDDLSKQEVEFIERGMVTLDDDSDSLSYVPKSVSTGTPTKIEIYNNTRHSSEYAEEHDKDDEDEDRSELIAVSIEFLGADDNEHHGLTLSLSPELATVIANAMLTHASSVTTVDVVSKTLIQGWADHEEEDRQVRRFWQYVYKKRLGIESEDDETEA